MKEQEKSGCPGIAGGERKKRRSSGRYSDFGIQAKIAMTKQGVSSKELAHRLGYAESTLCDVLKGRNCNERRRKEIKKILQLDAEG